MITSCMIMLNTTVKNATSDRVVTIDIIYRIIRSLTDKSIICNICRTNPVIIIIIQYTIRICLAGGFCPGGFCPGGFVRGVLSGGFVRGGFVRGFFPGGGVVRGILGRRVLSGGALSIGVLSPGGFGRGVLSGGGGGCLGGFCLEVGGGGVV